MSAQSRGLLLIIVFTFGVVVLGSRWSIHMTRLESIERERVDELKRKREHDFAASCAAHNGRTLISYPELCVERGALIEVMP